MWIEFRVSNFEYRTMGVQIDTRIRNDAHIIDVDGEVDLYSSPAMRKQIFETIKQHRPKVIVIELTQVSYMDSSGIATLVEGLQLSKEYKTRFKLVGLSQHVLEVFQLARLERVFEIYSTEDDAFNDA